MLAYDLVYAEKNVTIDKKTPQQFSWAETFFILIFIKCRTDKNNVHIESLYLIGY